MHQARIPSLFAAAVLAIAPAAWADSDKGLPADQVVAAIHAYLAEADAPAAAA